MSDKSKKSNFTIAMQELLGGKTDSNPKEDEVAVKSENPVLSKVPDKKEMERTFVTAQESYLKQEPMNMMQDYEFDPVIPSNECSIILDDMVIVGSITSSSDIDMRGSVEGNISSTTNVVVSGTIDGDLVGRNVNLDSGAVQGKVATDENLILNKKALVLGDIDAKNMKTNGRIKGNIKIDNQMNIEDNAVILGDICTNYLSVQNGAVISGRVEVLSRDVDEEMFQFRRKN